MLIVVCYCLLLFCVFVCLLFGALFVVLLFGFYFVVFRLIVDVLGCLVIVALVGF